MLALIAALIVGTGCAACASVNDLTPPSCTYAAVPNAASFDADGGSGVLAMTAAGVCAWSVSSSVPWLTLPGATTGSGNADVPFVVSVNPGGASRTASLTTAAGEVTVTQGGAACTYSVSPESVRIASNGGKAIITVATSSACPWTATSADPWISITRGASSTGNGTVEITVDRLTAVAGRAGAVTVANQRVSVTQDGAGCTIGVTPSTADISANGGTATFHVTADGSCDWSATSQQSWLTIAGASNGRGDGTVTYRAQANTDTAERIGRIVVGNQTFVVTQSAASAPAPPAPPAPPPCDYAVAPTTVAIAQAGGNQTATVTAGPGCGWTAAANATWLSITAGRSGSGNGTVTYEVASNTTTLPRTGTLTIAGKTLTVTQSGTPCTFALMPTSKSFDEKAHNDHVDVHTLPDCSWSAVSNAAWLVITSNPPGGMGDGRINYGVSPNASPDPRTGAITIGGKTLTVTQQGK